MSEGGFVQQKNSVLADRRHARHVAELRRVRKEAGPKLWTHFTMSAGLGVIFAGDMMKRALRALENRFKKHYGLTGVTYNVNTDPESRECRRRRRQIAAGILTESNGLVRA